MQFGCDPGSEKLGREIDVLIKEQLELPNGDVGRW